MCGRVQQEPWSGRLGAETWVQQLVGPWQYQCSTAGVGGEGGWVVPLPCTHPPVQAPYSYRPAAPPDDHQFYMPDTAVTAV